MIGRNRGKSVDAWEKYEHAREVLGAEELLTAFATAMNDQNMLEEIIGYIYQDFAEELSESRCPRGRMMTEDKDTGWHGIRGAKFIYHGDWADPEIVYKGVSLNYYDVDEAAYDVYKEEHPKSDDVSEREYVNEYEDWLDTPEGKNALECALLDLAAA